MKKKSHNILWVRLDNAAKIYPAARRKNWSSVFRQSVTLYESVDIEILKGSLDVIVKRFPTIAACLREGVFWYYLQQVDKAPDIKDEYSYPLVYMSKEEMRKCAFRVIVYNNRIAVEFFHSLTDGSGALIFLKNLVAEYLERKYKISIPFEHGILDRKEEPKEEELEDSFPKFANKYSISRKDANAWRLDGELEDNGFVHLTCFKLSVKECIDLAHKYNCTLTVFMSAVIMKALCNLQNEKNPIVKHQKLIKLSIPINLRNIFPSNTLRNFSMYSNPELDPRIGEYSLKEICDLIKSKLLLEFNEKHMSRVIATNVKDEQNIFVRLIPLPLKNIILKTIFDIVGESKFCLSFSNLGKIQFPLIMDQYIERFDFILGVLAQAPYNCGMSSYKDTVYVNFIRNIKNPELEKHFYKVLKELGMSIEVESNLNAR